MKPPVILAIDTSCDETSAAVTRGRTVLSNVVASQINIHQKYGGVVPHLAKRAHEAKIDFVVHEAINRAKARQINFGAHNLSPLTAGVSTPKISSAEQVVDAVAVTVGPGLAPALEVGITYAKKMAREWKKPLIAINHLEGHLLSSLANMEGSDPSNFLGLIVSGGHTELVYANSIGQYLLLGQTLDDAAGEALDKLAKMLRLGYPGGPIVEQLAKQGNPDAIALPVPMQHSRDLNFSFSGLKTAAMYQIKNVGSVLTKKQTADFCASFQKTIALSLTTKLKKAIELYRPKAILLGGGVLANLYLRRQIRLAAKPLPVLIPYSKKLFTDNAAMIAVTASWHYLTKNFADPTSLDRQPRLNFPV